MASDEPPPCKDNMDRGSIFYDCCITVEGRITVGFMIFAALLLIFGRFRDIVPYDDTRVHLVRNKGDYINASHVNVSVIFLFSEIGFLTSLRFSKKFVYKY